jgi:hypothetical protein
MSRPFKVLGIQQIAIGASDKHALRKLWVDLFGLPITGHFSSDKENVDEDICAIGAGPFTVEVDLMQPLDPDKKPAQPRGIMDRRSAPSSGLVDCPRFAIRAGRYSQRGGGF